VALFLFILRKRRSANSSKEEFDMLAVTKGGKGMEENSQSVSSEDELSSHSTSASNE
jgi:hypothetical protein